MKFLGWIALLLQATLVQAQPFCFDWKPFSFKQSYWQLFREEQTKDPYNPNKIYKFRIYDPVVNGPGPHCEAPENGKWPVVVALAGSAESGVDNKAQIENGALAHLVIQHPDVFCAVFIFPQTPSDTVWDTKFAIAALAAAKASREGTNYEIDEKRQYAMGLSLGGFGVCDLLRHEKIFAGGVSFSGCLDDGGPLPSAEKVCDELKAKPLAPLWMFHGLADAGGEAGGVDPKSSQVFWQALECARKTSPALSTKYRLTEILELGHCSWGCASIDDLEYNSSTEPAKNPLKLCNTYKVLGSQEDQSAGDDIQAAFHWLMNQNSE